MRPIRATVRPFSRAIVLSFLWSNRKEIGRWVTKAKEVVISGADSLKAEIHARRARRIDTAMAASTDVAPVPSVPDESMAGVVI